MRNRALQYHISALITIKNLMGALKSIEDPVEFNNAMLWNDKLTEILNAGEKYFKNFILKFNYSKESLELYILFLRNAMVQ